MVKAIRFHETGGPEVLKLEDVTLPDVGPDMIRVKHDAMGVNYIDTYHRTGLYPLPAYPSGLGLEGAGTILEVGANVADLKAGDRIAYGTGPIGAYAEEVVMPAEKVVKVPDGVSAKEAAGMMLRGMTVEYLLQRTFKVEAGMPVLFHAAAGGVGLIAGQWLKAIGATAIGTVGSAQKAELAKANGYEHVINYNTENFVDRVKEITNGKGVPVVYDGVGAAVFDASLDCLAPRGMMVTFGNASGPVPPVDLLKTNARGSLFVTRPGLMHYCGQKDEMRASAKDLFALVTKGAIKIDVGQEYALADAAQAHIDLEGRKTTGSTILVP